MAISHNIKGDLVEIKVAGHFSIDELLAGFRQVLNDDQLPLKSHILIDVTKSEEVPPIDVMKRIVSVLCEKRERLSSRLAVLVANIVRFGKARQLGVLLECDGIEAQPFYDREEAKEWLTSIDL